MTKERQPLTKRIYVVDDENDERHAHVYGTTAKCFWPHCKVTRKVKK
jgi:hypothetical protein